MACFPMGWHRTGMVFVIQKGFSRNLIIQPITIKLMGNSLIFIKSPIPDNHLAAC